MLFRLHSASCKQQRDRSGIKPLTSIISAKLLSLYRVITISNRYLRRRTIDSYIIILNFITSATTSFNLLISSAIPPLVSTRQSLILNMYLTLALQPFM